MDRNNRKKSSKIGARGVKKTVKKQASSAPQPTPVAVPDLRSIAGRTQEVMANQHAILTQLVNQAIMHHVNMITQQHAMNAASAPAAVATDEDLPNIDENGVQQQVPQPPVIPPNPIAHLFAQYGTLGMVNPEQHARNEIARIYNGEMGRMLTEGMPHLQNLIQGFASQPANNPLLQPMVTYHTVLAQEQRRIELEQMRQRAEAERDKVINVHGLLTDSLHYAKEALDLETSPEIYDICERIEAQLSRLGDRMVGHRL